MGKVPNCKVQTVSKVTVVAFASSHIRQKDMCHLKAGHTPSLQGSGLMLFGRFRGEKQNPLNSNNMLLTETGGREIVANEKH